MHDKTVLHVKGLLTAAQAEELGRAVFAATVLNDGHVALTCITDHKRSVGVFSVYGDTNLALHLDALVKSPREYEADAAK